MRQMISHMLEWSLKSVRSLCTQKVSTGNVMFSVGLHSISRQNQRSSSQLVALNDCSGQEVANIDFEQPMIASLILSQHHQPVFSSRTRAVDVFQEVGAQSYSGIKPGITFGSGSGSIQAQSCSERRRHVRIGYRISNAARNKFHDWEWKRRCSSRIARVRRIGCCFCFGAPLPNNVVAYGYLMTSNKPVFSAYPRSFPALR